jgi:hypothetical protein
MIFISLDLYRREESPQLIKIKIWELWKFYNFEPRNEKRVFFSVQASLMLWYQFVVHTGPKANTNKTQTSRFTWLPKTRYVHGGSRLYIIRGMIQTLNSTQYNPTKLSVSLLHSVFLSNLLFLTLTVALFSSAHLHSYSLHSLVSVSIYRRKKSLSSNPCAA